MNPHADERGKTAIDRDPESLAYWMRGHYSFVQLCNLVQILALHPQGLRPSELNHLALNSYALRTQQGKIPALTTLYHMRRALLKLGIAKYRDMRLVVTNDDALVAELLQSMQDGPILTPRERTVLTNLVIRNEDCRRTFFDLFMIGDPQYGRVDFVQRGHPITWTSSSLGPHIRQVQFTSGLNSASLRLTREVQIQAVLYGIRYWARDELLIVDEVFVEGRGNVIFPIVEPGTVETGDLIDAILSDILSFSEWTTISVEDIILKWAVTCRVSIVQIHQAIIRLYHDHPDLVALLATPRSLATLTAVSHLRQNLELRKYLLDDDGRYISHIRLHRRLLEVQYDRGTGTAQSAL